METKSRTASTSFSAPVPMQRVAGLVDLPSLFTQFGIDTNTVLDEVGLTADALARPDLYIPFECVGRLLDVASRRTGCGHFGLLAGRSFHLPMLGLPGELALNAPNVGEARRQFTLHQFLNSQGAVMYMRASDGVVDSCYAIYQPGVVGHAQILATAMAAIFNSFRTLCGPQWLPLEVTLAFSRPADITPYRNFFRAPVRFDSEISAIRFREHWLALPIAGADAARFRQCLAQGEAVARTELVDQVRRALRSLLGNGQVSGDVIARVLSMHRRTLNRRLGEIGTTFKDLLDQMRFEVAQQLLRDTDIAIDDIAASLGYSSVSPFTRTFRRWSSTTPARWRREVRTNGRQLPGNRA